MAGAAARAALAAHRERIARALAARPARLAERDEPYHEAAVALILRPSEAPEDVELLLVRRAVRAGDPWSGQIGLPGGRFAPVDESLEATAIRETREEVGLDLPARGVALGALDELRPRTPVLPPIIVRPFVWAVEGAPALAPNHEIAEARWVRLGDLFRPTARVRTEVEVREVRLNVDAFQLGDFTIWGMTERILTTFEEVWR
ncbi:MAG: CoA pyrophosphatase [Gemmatimonadaceae bacterium]